MTHGAGSGPFHICMGRRKQTKQMSRRQEKRKAAWLLAAVDEIAPNRIVVDRETWLKGEEGLRELIDANGDMIKGKELDS